MEPGLKILLMGDASNYHATLAQALIAKGHRVTVASGGSGWMATRRDIDLSRGSGRIGGAWLWTRLNTTLRNSLRGYDIVQLCDTSFINLQPERQLAIARRLKLDNGLLSICALGTNPIYVYNLKGKSPALDYSEWHDGAMEQESRLWTTPRMLDYAHNLFSLADCVTTALYEYHRVLQVERPDLELTYAGIPVDINSISRTHQITNNNLLHIMLTSHPGREKEKGDFELKRLAEYIVAESKDQIKIHSLEPMPFNEFSHWLSLYDVVSDQLYAYTPATTALMSMARGVVPLTGCHPDYLDFIGHDPTVETGIINTTPDTLDSVVNRLLDMAQDTDLRRQMSMAAQQFVLTNNAADIVADRTLSAWLEHS